jgi:hypothetical protein
MQRPDISPFVTHFTKATAEMPAFNVLLKILRDRFLLGSNTYIRGGAKCVCFTEAPVEVIQFGMCGLDGRERYSPYGIQIAKSHLFRLGGRPVIYQSDSEFEILPESYRWRHVRLDLRSERPIDFTWEREWRIQSDRFDFSDQDVTVVVPDDESEDRLRDFVEHESFQDACQWSTVIGDEAWSYASPSPWKTIRLKKN